MDKRQSNRNMTSNHPENESHIKSVVGATKELLENMEETKHELKGLQNIVKQDEKALDQLSNDVKNLKQLINQNKAHLEINATMKKTIEEYNSKFLSFAQMIYVNGQELYNDLNSVKKEDKKVLDIFMTKEAEYKLMVESYAKEERELLISLDVIKKKNLENERRQNEEEKKNQEMKQELHELNEKIQWYENELSKNDEISLSQEKSLYEANIVLLNDKITFFDNKIAILTQSLQTAKTSKWETEKEVNKNIEVVDNLCKELEETYNNENCKLTELKNKISELSYLDSEISLKSDEIEKAESNYRDLETKLHYMEENHKRDLASCERSIIEKEEVLKNEKKINEDLVDAMNNLNDKMKKTEAEILDMQASIRIFENMPEDHLDQEQEAKQLELVQIRTSKRELKEQVKKIESEQTKKIVAVKTDIELLKKNTKQLMDELNRKQTEITQMRSEIEKIELQNKELENNMIEQNKEIKMLVNELESEKKIIKPVQRASLSTPKKQEKTLRNWDSESSWEGDDRTFSTRARMKVRKLAQSSSKSFFL